jgi:branched-subunit amino acid aminotransferase/4-amino-4-deoxychorismate lyase
MAIEAAPGRDILFGIATRWEAARSEVEGLALIEGEVVSLAEARVPLGWAAVLSGEGLFETIRVVEGELLRFGAHVARLRAAARQVGLAGGLPTSPRPLVAPLLEAWGARDGVLKLVLAAGETPGAAQLLAMMTPTRPLPAGARERGVTVEPAAGACGADTPTAGLKTLSRMDWGLTRRAVRVRGHFDALLVDAHGRVTEGTVTNIFWVTGGVICTPAARLGVLPGVVRAEVLEWARWNGRSAHEGDWQLQDLLDADEAFLTNALVGALPLRAVGDRVLGACPGPVTIEVAGEIGRAAAAANGAVMS